ncbi:MAG: metal-sensitive transcriptional regulator [Opitutaceae bacterium]|jgi:DNA-binding FrmR family transcriptional regulator|nr:metal-sensitive transcriptional regulator [Opitutaceae bacterium]
MSDIHHHPEKETQALRARVRKIAGQVNGIERMLLADRDCAEILLQLLSVRKAIKSLSEKIIHAHIRDCINGTADGPDAKRRLRELTNVLERYVE